jgi:hypothetical protein
MLKPCKDCPQGFRVEDLMDENGQVDFTKINLPQIYHAPNPGTNPLQQMQYALPPFDGVKRDFQRPVFEDDGSIEYPKLNGDFEPPPNIEGYVRDKNNPWRFTPEWPECASRYHGVKMRPCGSIQVKMACQNPESEHNGENVTCEDCQGCPVRTLFKIGE